MKPFTREQLQLIENGSSLVDKLALRVEQALGISSSRVEVKRHAYIQSPPGAGKTFTVQAIADQHKVPLLKIQGAASMSNLVVRLAVAVNNLEPGESQIVWIDDCDGLFVDKESLNVMKGVLDEDRNVLAYNKNLTTQIAQYENSTSEADRLKAAALRRFQTPGMVGVEIPTDQLRFIITSNVVLEPPNGDLRTQRKMHEAAIRDRVNYVEFALTSKKSWGWAASIILKIDLLGLDEEQKRLLLDFMYVNWDRLPSTSMRKVKDLAAMMINHPDNYPDYWEIELTTDGD